MIPIGIIPNGIIPKSLLLMSPILIFAMQEKISLH